MNPTTIKLAMPTNNTDGTPITAGEVTGVQFLVGTTSGQYGPPINDAAFPGDIDSTGVLSTGIAALGALAPGTYFAAARVVTANTESALSNEVSFTLAAAPEVPNPPTNFSIS